MYFTPQMSVCAVLYRSDTAFRLGKSLKYRQTNSVASGRGGDEEIHSPTFELQSFAVTRDLIGRWVLWRPQVCQRPGAQRLRTRTKPQDIPGGTATIRPVSARPPVAGLWLGSAGVACELASCRKSVV